MPLRPNESMTEVSRRLARRDKIRAYVKVAGRRYEVHSKGHKYTVWLNIHTRDWECTCPYQRSPRYPERRCKHIVRVRDREEQRVHKENRAATRIPSEVPTNA